MGRRKKRKTITYDSKETATLTGLFFILTGIFFAVSIFTTSPNNDTLFDFARSIFGNATILATAFFVSTGLKFLGVNHPFNKNSSIFAQFFLLLLIPALLTAFSTTSTLDAIRGGAERSAGGEVGYFVIKNVFNDVIPTQIQGVQDGTKIVLVLLTLVFLPIGLSLSISQTVEYIKKFLAWIWKQIDYALISGTSSTNNDKKSETSILEPQKATRFGDFNSRLNKNKENLTKESVVQSKTDFNDTQLKSQLKKKEVNIDDVKVKEGELGEDGLSQSELHYPNWKLPPLTLLEPFKKTTPKEADTKEKAEIIEQILSSFNIEAKVEDAYIGPSVIQYALNIPLGIKVSKVATLSENIALALGVDSKAVRIETIPETTYLGIEVPRTTRDMVRMKELMSSDEMNAAHKKLPVPVGKNIHGETVIAGIEKMPHLLIAGATGSGKSVLTNSFITSIIMQRTPDEVKLILVDPKQVELIDYNGIPHLLTPVITDMDKVVNALKWAVNEMENRYTLLANSQVRNIEGYNEKMGFAAMPYIVVVIDEMADMMMTSNRVEAENAIVRLAQKARAVGIHLILATQRPSVNVITGIIKANIPGRIGMSVTSSTDSRVILDKMGAESLMGQGDLLWKAPDKTKSERLQGAFIEQEEVIRVVDYIKAQAPEVEYINEITEKHMSDEEATQEALGDISGDSLVEQAIRVVVQSQKGSSSYLQRRLSIGFNRAAKLLEELEEAGVVGPANGPKPRDVLISDADAFIEQLRANS